MNDRPDPRPDRRHDARFTLPAAYAPVQIRLLDDHAGRGVPGDLLGHAYDISATGLRFELDEPLPAGARFAIRLELPGRPGGIAPANSAPAAVASRAAASGKPAESARPRPASIIEATPSPAIYAIATLVWRLDDPDEPGPARMGARFEGFPRASDQRRLRDLISDGRYAAAA